MSIFFVFFINLFQNLESFTFKRYSMIYQEFHSTRHDFCRFLSLAKTQLFSGVPGGDKEHNEQIINRS